MRQVNALPVDRNWSGWGVKSPGHTAPASGRFSDCSETDRKDSPLPPPDGANHVSRPLGQDWRSEEHTAELQSLMRISYAVICLQKITTHMPTSHTPQLHYSPH